MWFLGIGLKPRCFGICKALGIEQKDNSPQTRIQYHGFKFLHNLLSISLFSVFIILSLHTNKPKSLSVPMFLVPPTHHRYTNTNSLKQFCMDPLTDRCGNIRMSIWHCANGTEYKSLPNYVYYRDELQYVNHSNFFF